MSLAWPSLPWRDQALDLALDLAGLAGLLVVVGLLQRLRRLRLDRRLHRGDERLLVERPGLLGVHRVGLGRLGLPGEVVGRGERGVLRLLGLRRRRRVRPLRLREPLHVARDLGERRVVLRLHAGRRDRRLEQLVRRQRSGRRRGSARRRRRRPPAPGALPPPAPFAAPAGFAAFAPPCPAGSPPAPAWAAAPASSAAPHPGPNPVVVTASADGGRLRSPLLEVDRHPGRLGRLQPLLDRVDAGSSRRISRSAASMSVTACSPGDRNRAAINARDGRVARGPLQRQQSRGPHGAAPAARLPCACPRRGRRPAAPPRPPASPARRP